MASLHEYKAWRNKLVPLGVGTIIQFNVKYSSYSGNSIREGQCFKIVSIGKGVMPVDNLPASLVYTLCLCNKSGKEFKRKLHWSVEGIARYLDEHTASLVEIGK